MMPIIIIISSSNGSSSIYLLISAVWVPILYISHVYTHKK